MTVPVPAPAAPKVTVIILTWNRVDDVVTCLESFSEVKYPNLEVVVVDNASADETVETLRARYDWITLIVNDDNLGYVGGNNVGIRYALEKGADYVFILNSDTKMIPNCLDELVRTMQADPRIAITGAKNLYMQNPAFSWGKYGVLNWGPMLCRTHGRFVRDYPESSPKDVDWVIGNGCMMSREALEKVGIFDNDFFQVNEDVDWCIRARKAGYRVVYVDTAAIQHRGASSADLSKPIVFSYGYFLGRNAILFAKKHANPFQFAWLLAMMVIGVTARISAIALGAAIRAVMSQEHFVTGMVDGFAGRLRRDKITIRMPIPTNEPPDTPVIRILRWLGA
ncbi:MAG TPA: glycosyltransferase family 2 protein [Candidatus Dormibacteraeota bacterium]|nr:glycosyltransferase family 2 protein [Candidatus Dormibacteraeota bacterium]